MTESVTETTVVTSSSQNNRSRLRVLHVDDDLGFLNIAKECLEMQGGFEVEIARSVEEAMLKMQKKVYDAVISDYQMPERDGLDFLKELRERGDRTPFIVTYRKGKRRSRD